MYVGNERIGKKIARRQLGRSLKYQALVEETGSDAGEAARARVT